MTTEILVLLTIAMYFIVLFTISYFVSRKSDNAGFFSGNRKSPWYLVAFGTVGAAISGVTFISVPGMVMAQQFGFMQMVFGFFVGQMIIAFILIPLYYKMNLISIYGYLEQRFGMSSYKTGAWFFFVSKMLGAAVRLFVVCIVLQLFVFDHFPIPSYLSFTLNVIFTVLFVYLYTFKGGIKSVVWVDTFQTLCMFVAIGLTIYFVGQNLGLNAGNFGAFLGESGMTRIFFLDDASSFQFFWKQFLAGIALTVALNGLDQDMMQRALTCKNSKDSIKNLVVGISIQTFVNLLFLTLGVLLFSYLIANNMAIPERSDYVFPTVVQSISPFLLILFVIGLLATSYSSAGSALTALTTSFTIDVLQTPRKKSDAEVTVVRKKVHIAMAVCMAAVIFLIWLLNNDAVINTVFMVASYTYGPLLGLFMFGLIMKNKVHDKWVPVVAIAAPVIILILDLSLAGEGKMWAFWHERIIYIAGLTFIGLCFLIKKGEKAKKLG